MSDLFTPFVVNGRMDDILTDLGNLLTEQTITVAIDMEWPVDITSGIHRPVSLIQIAYKETIYLIQVC